MVMILPLLLLVLLATLWMYASSRRRAKRRRSDYRDLSAAERVTFKKAEQFFKEGKVIGAAQAMESMGMTREAVYMLEAKKYYHEAASILLRIRRPGRAGSLYARNGLFREAASCYEQGNQFADAAKCYLELGEYDKAGRLYEKVASPGEAADAYRKGRHFRRAAHLYIEMNDVPQAIKMLRYVIKGQDHAPVASLNQEELNFLYAALITLPFDKDFVGILAKSGRLRELISELLVRSRISEAVEYLKHGNSELPAALLSNPKLAATHAQDLALLYEQAEQFEYAGMAYERMGQFKKAGEAFERAGIVDRAAYCFERCGESSRYGDRALDARPKKPTFEDEDTRVSFKKASPSFAISQTTVVDGVREEFTSLRLFQGVEPSYLKELWSLGNVHTFEPGEVIVTRDQTLIGFYAFISGDIQVEERDTVSAPYSIGEKWVFFDQDIACHVRAITRTEAHVIHKDVFSQFLEEHGPLTRQLYKKLTHMGA